MSPIGASGTHMPTDESQTICAAGSHSSISSQVGSAPPVLHPITRGPWHANWPSRQSTHPSPGTHSPGRQFVVSVAVPLPSQVVAMVPSQ
jgi:hypothetical protein